MRYRRLLLPVSLFVSALSLVAADDVKLRAVFRGRTEIEPHYLSKHGEGLETTAFFQGDAVQATVYLFSKSPISDALDTARRIQWTFIKPDGSEVTPSVTVERSQEPVPVVYTALGARARAEVQFGGVVPGWYVVRATLPKGGAADEVYTAQRVRIVVYRGDENEVVKREWLLVQARAALASGTIESFLKARPLLLEAARGSDNPSIYEMLADAAAPWASPDETATYYDRSLAVAKANVARVHGEDRSKWPKQGESLIAACERKVEAFKRFMPEYVQRFHEVRVVVASEGGVDRFVVERRKDGARLKVIDFRRSARS